MVNKAIYDESSLPDLGIAVCTVVSQAIAAAVMVTYAKRVEYHFCVQNYINFIQLMGYSIGLCLDEWMRGCLSLFR